MQTKSARLSRHRAKIRALKSSREVYALRSTAVAGMCGLFGACQSVGVRVARHDMNDLGGERTSGAVVEQILQSRTTAAEQDGEADHGWPFPIASPPPADPPGNAPHRPVRAPPRPRCENR